MPTISDLRQRQALPLDAKISMAMVRIRDWYNYFDGDVCVSFSGGKDSTVLAHLVHSFYPDVPLVFSNTGLEYPEIQAFAKKMGAVFIRPKMMFSEVISKYGYPIISKEVSEAIHCARQIIPKGESRPWYERKRAEMYGESKFKDGVTTPYNKKKYFALAQNAQFKIHNYCCHAMKKSPLTIYQKKNKLAPYIATMTDESRLRETLWTQKGCNIYDGTMKSSRPISVWTEQDVLQYIKREGIEIASVYGDIVCVDDCGFEYEPLPGIECKLKCTGCQRTGCIFCGYGVHLEKGETRFQRLARTHPKQYEYCLQGGQWADNTNYDPAAPEYDGKWKNWNPKKIWVPSKKGLGMKKVFDDCNEIYGKDFIRYD